MKMIRNVVAGALACAMVAGSGASAFATEAAAEGPETLNTSGETPVYIDVDRAVLRVAVPVDLRLVASSAGGALTCPSDGAYGIWNYSTNVPVFVGKVEALYNEQVNPGGAQWRLVSDPALVGAYRETDGAELANVMVTLVAPDAKDDSYVLDTATAKLPGVGDTTPWRIERATAAAADGAEADAADGAEVDPAPGVQGTFFPINFLGEGCANSIVGDAHRANRMSTGDEATGIDPAAAFRVRFTITTARP